MRYLEKYCSFSVADLKAAGLLERGKRTSCELRWEYAGRPVSSCTVTADLQGPPRLVLSFVREGVEGRAYIPLVFIPSNLKRGGYYLFICPEQGKTCRKLYLYKGCFVCRQAVGAAYRSQAENYMYRKYRSAYMLTKYNALEDQRRRRTYAGKPTTYARKLARAAKMAGLVS